MNKPIISWESISGKQVLKFTFTGHLELGPAKEAIVEWRKICETEVDRKVIIIWDCLQMTGYDLEVRTTWQEALKEMKIYIDSLWVVSNSTLIRMGSMAMSMFASYKIKVVKSYDMISF